MITPVSSMTDKVCVHGYGPGDHHYESGQCHDNPTAAWPQNGEVRTTSSTGGQKGVKPERYSLLPRPALDQIARIYAYGAEKYSAHNWRLGYEWSKSYDALLRHLTAFWDGEDIDPESGLPHLASAGFHIMTLLTYMEEHPEHDDRPKKPEIEIDRNEYTWSCNDPEFVRLHQNHDALVRESLTPLKFRDSNPSGSIVFTPAEPKRRLHFPFIRKLTRRSPR